MPQLPTQFLISRPELNDVLAGLPVQIGKGVELRLHSKQVTPQPALVQRLQAALLPLAEITVDDDLSDGQHLTISLPAGVIRAAQRLV